MPVALSKWWLVLMTAWIAFLTSILSPRHSLPNRKHTGNELFETRRRDFSRMTSPSNRKHSQPMALLSSLATVGRRGQVQTNPLITRKFENLNLTFYNTRKMNEKRGDTGDSPRYKSKSYMTYLGMKSETFTKFSDLARFFLIHGS